MTKFEQLWREVRTGEIRRRRALGPKGRMAERAERVDTLNRVMREWMQEVPEPQSLATPKPQGRTE